LGAAIPDNKPWSTGISGSNSFATRTFAYDAGLQPTTETFGSSGLFPNRVVTRDYEPSGSGYVHGRSSGFEVSTSPAYAASYAYDGTTGRLNRVTGPGLPTGTGANYGAWYLYRSGSDLVGQTQFKSDDNTKLLPAIRAYETDRDLLSHVNAYWRPDGANNLISSYFYRNDALGRRWAVSNQGLAFAATGDRVSVWSHNDRNELTASHRYEGIDPEDPGDPVPTEQFTYAYDPIGNRTDATEGTTVTSDYHPNDLNQYGFIRTNTTGGNPAVQYPTYDADGNLSETYVVGDMNGDGRCDNFDLSMFSYAVTHTEGDFEAQYPNGCFWCADINGDALVNNFDITPFMALLGENAAIDVRYTWDAENRLIAVEPGGTPASGDVKLTFAYDYMGRRIEKKVYDWDSQAQDWEETPSLDRRFVWAGGGTGGWLMLMELDGLDSNAVVRQYTWGLDLAGQSGVASGGPAGRLDGLEAAGSIGGLLAVHDETVGENGADYVYTYDANGNVGQVVDLSAASASASIVAHYEYDPYGNVTAQSGAYAEINPFRFSTKYWDDETGLGYWGYRYYSPKLGRWMSRDPIGEDAGDNIYAYGSGDPLNRSDPLGWCVLGDGQPCVEFPPLIGWPNPPPDALCPKGPPVYHGNCPNCGSVCANQSTNGETRCQGGKPCSCICDDNIRNNNPGAPPGLGGCIAAHEAVHVGRANNDPKGPEGCEGQPDDHAPKPSWGGENSECAADQAQVECACRDGTIDGCKVDGPNPQKARAACLNALIDFVKATPCAPDEHDVDTPGGKKSYDTNCPAGDFRRCGDAKAACLKKLQDALSINSHSKWITDVRKAGPGPRKGH
jgi:RHS repeat-associated protein